MTIKCAVCPSISPTFIKSLEIDQKKAIQEVSNKLSAHLIRNHIEHTRNMQMNIMKVNQMLVWFLLMSQGAFVPETETFLATEIENARMELVKLLGVEIIGNKDDVKIVEVDEENEEENIAEATK